MPRVLKVILAAVLAILAVAAGTVVMLAVATAFLGFVLARLIRRRLGPAAPRRPVPGPAAQGDVIDVVATEVTTSGQPLPPAGHFGDEREKS